MPMSYADSAISGAEVPRAAQPVFQHLLDTHASETSKVFSVWRQFSEDDLSFRPHARSSSVLDIFKHQLLSERRFFGEFLTGRFAMGQADSQSAATQFLRARTRRTPRSLPQSSCISTVEGT